MSKLRDFFKRLFPARRYGYMILGRVNRTHAETIRRLDEMDRKLEYLFWLSQMREGEELRAAQKRVYAKMPAAENEVRVVQQANHAILRRLKTVCDEHGLAFSLAMGTMLGAVRHQGFVPWDDDVDVAMLRAHFQKLRTILRDDPELRLDTYYSTNCWQFAKVKFRDSESFYVDVFILDEFDAGAQNLSDRYAALSGCADAYTAAIREAYARHGIEAAQIKAPQRNAVIEREMRKCYDAQTKELGYCGRGDYICFGIDNPPFIRNQGYVYRRDEMFPLVNISFEGETYHVFRNYDRWLRNAYGDYWSLPKNIVSGHSDFSEVSPEDPALKRLGLSLGAAREIEKLNIHF